MMLESEGRDPMAGDVQVSLRVSEQQQGKATTGFKQKGSMISCLGDLDSWRLVLAPQLLCLMAVPQLRQTVRV